MRYLGFHVFNVYFFINKTAFYTSGHEFTATSYYILVLYMFVIKHKL